jgi:Flp pilus assembly protein TadG
MEAMSQGRRPREEGQALVELVLVGNLLAVLMLAIFQFGIAFSHYIDVTDAARAGARKAATSGALAVLDAARQTTATTAGQASAYNSLGCSPPPASCWANGMLVTWKFGNETGTSGWIAGNSVTATVSVPLTISILGVSLPSPSTLQSSATMRIEKAAA